MVQGGGIGGGTIIIGGGAGAPQGGAVAAAQSGETAEGFVAGGGAGIAAAVGTAVAAADLTANQQLAADMAEAQTSYLDELKKLTETLQKVSEQSARPPATARKWKTSTVLSPASARFTRCSSRAQASR